MKLIFMGTPDFAVPALQALVDSEHEVLAVYTQPPRPAHRGHKEQKSPVHLLAESHDVEVRTPSTLKDEETQKAFSDLNADAAIVAAYGLLLPKPILAACQHGCINIHPSLLPRWRGAAPIQHTIIAGDTETGICIMQMDEGLDTGAILSKQIVTMPSRATAGELHDALAQKGAQQLLETLVDLDNITPTPQSEEGVTYANKLSKEDGHIDWSKPAKEVDAHIRGVTPWPGAWCTHDGEIIKLLAADYTDESTDAAPGTVIDDHFTVACASGTIRPTLLQRQGKKAMSVDEFLRGFSISTGSKLE